MELEKLRELIFPDGEYDFYGWLDECTPTEIVKQIREILKAYNRS